MSDASRGSYLSPEPLLQDPNWLKEELQAGYQVPAYGYAANNPVTNGDPTGLWRTYQPPAGAGIQPQGQPGSTPQPPPYNWNPSPAPILPAPSPFLPRLFPPLQVPYTPGPGPSAMCMARQWTCEASCNVQAIPGQAPPTFPARVTGTGTGSNEGDACREAKRSATQSAPAGTYTRHCQCFCSK